MQFAVKRAQSELTEISNNQLLREVKVNPKGSISFACNDYLGFSRAPELVEVGKAALSDYGVGSRSSTVVAGYSDVHHALEEMIAKVTGRDDAIFFPNAFLANQAVFDALISKHDKLYVHRENHASLNQPLLTGQYQFKRFAVCPEIPDDESAWLISDHIFSVTGKRGSIDAYLKQPALCFIDDIHGVGVFGDKGLSLAEKYSQSELPLLSWGFGKALGCYGGAILGEQSLIDLLRQKTKSYLYSTAVPAYMIEVAKQALVLSINGSIQRSQLQHNISYFSKRATADEIQLEHYSKCPIFCLWFSNVNHAVSVNRVLQEKGILTTLMRWPTVSPGTACIRIVIRADHSQPEMDRLLLGLKQTRDDYGY